MKSSTRISFIAGFVVFLSLVSGVSFAAWSASSTQTATASAGAVALTTATASGVSTISALGPHTYTASNQSLTKAITVRNTGTVEATVSTIAITRSGTLGGDQIAVKFWVGTNSSCAATTPVVSTTLAGGTVSLSTLNMKLASTGSAILCTSTTFTGSLVSQAGKTTTATFAVNSSAGTNWNATDVVAEAGRSFTQSVAVNSAPKAPSAIRCETHNNQKIAIVSWTAPTGFDSPNGGYKIYFNGVLNRTTTDTSVELAEHGVNAEVTVRAVALDGSESVDSAAVAIVSTNKGNGGSVCGP
ncbi:hypothetical protein [Salinibacterium sp. SWN1162]|uniref:hypothetical protein n=1 Tax=Salinibacterium sp. SWN1162 TaxID=2792053 RepID=UPI0018CCD0F7|nr:hypothetical protein [Salinibacterium sp. SWN1162]MBH0008425.1 hypothetical protein [Salinibacterium sp. SWN1162]